jgi:hypothetical protein
MTSEEKGSRVSIVTKYLRDKFPAGEVSSREFASALTPVFRVAQEYVERQLEFSKPVFEEPPEKLTELLTKHQVPARMGANSGKRTYVASVQDEITVSVEGLRAY